jgi:hypothetical protein
MGEGLRVGEKWDGPMVGKRGKDGFVRLFDGV